MTKQFKKCATQFTTKTGTFTFHNERVPRCKAKVLCAKKGEILAPFTNKEDLDAVKAIVKPECSFYNNGLSVYHIGLDVRNCGSEQCRVFSNNELWDDQKHGPLYLQVKNPVCPMANIRFFSVGPLVISDLRQFCETTKFGYVCLKPADQCN